MLPFTEAGGGCVPSSSPGSALAIALQQILLGEVRCVSQSVLLSGNCDSRVAVRKSVQFLYLRYLVWLTQYYVVWTVYTCPSWKRLDCRVHLAVLQTSEHFDSCVCDPSHSDASSCLDIQKTIFLHACVLQEGN